MVKTDNRPENLVALTNTEHGRLHRFIDAGRYKEAQVILVRACSAQAFWILNPEHLEAIEATPIQDILKDKNGKDT